MHPIHAEPGYRSEQEAGEAAHCCKQTHLKGSRFEHEHSGEGQANECDSRADLRDRLSDPQFEEVRITPEAGRPEWHALRSVAHRVAKA